MTPSVLIFCGAPLVGRPISQRIATFGAYLAAHGCDVRLTAVDPTFDGTPFASTDPISGAEIEIIGPTHYRVDADGSRIPTSPVAHLRDCHEIAKRLRALAKDMNTDRIMISTTVPASLYAVVALRLSPPPVWLDVDDWSAAQFVAGGGAALMGTAYAALERTVPRVAHRVTACSNELANLFPRATVVPNFIRLSDVPERPSVPASAGTVRVAFPSSVTAYHGHLPLLEALARRRRDLDGIKFSVVGDGDALDECRALVAREQLGDVVRFTGWLDRAAMLDELVRSDVSVIPLQDTRLDRARFPLKMLDALACGTVIAASDTGMVGHTLADRETALLSPPGDMDALVGNVLELAGAPELRERLSTAGRALVRDYDEDVVCARWMDLLIN